METGSNRPLILRILGSRWLWTLVFIVVICLAISWGSFGLSGNVMDKQAQFVADSVRRSAVQCYAIEGRYPSTMEGVAYLEESYGLAIDHKRYIVYYESMGDNLIPQIRVVALSDNPGEQDINDTLGPIGGGGQRP